MYQDWVKIKDFGQWYQAEIGKALLADHNIQSIIINKQDSAYAHIGDIELYVNRDNALRATYLISKMDNN